MALKILKVVRDCIKDVKRDEDKTPGVQATQKFPK